MTTPSAHPAAGGRPEGPGVWRTPAALGPARRRWVDVREGGTALGMRFVLGLVTLCGRGAARLFVRPLALYYVLTRASLRRCSRSYLTRVGRGAGLADVYRHVRTFAFCALDRALFLQGRTDLFDVTLTGHEHLVDLVRAGRGALLLGAHVGSFEAMRSAAARWRIPITVVMNTSNARRMQALASQLDPEGALRILDVREEDVGSALRIREVVERGELVALLADRVGPSERYLVTPFLGAPAAFPTGPYRVAAALGCPVYLAFGIYRGGNRYALCCEPFAERLELPRPREDSLRRYVERFVARLEHHCRRAPDNWFNLFDFWEEPPAGRADA